MSVFTDLLKFHAPTFFAPVYDLSHDKAFHLLEARRGRGKSYIMAYWALQALKSKTKVIANFHFNNYWLAYELRKERIFSDLGSALAFVKENVQYVDNWDQILVSYDALIFLDEVNRLFDSTFRTKDDRVPQVVFEWLQLSRRNKITLVFAAQSMDWLTPRVRQLFDYLWRVKKEVVQKGRDKGSIKCFWGYGSDPFSQGIRGKVQEQPDFRFSVPFASRIYKVYDTLERIKAIENTSQFSKFYDIYNYQLENGIIPKTKEKKCSLWSNP